MLRAHPVGGKEDSSSPASTAARTLGGLPLKVDIRQPARNRRRAEHHARVDRDQEQPELLAAGPGDRDHHGQQRPGQHVICRGAGQRDAADPGAVHVSVGEDACQHRKRSDRHGRAHE